MKQSKQDKLEIEKANKRNEKLNQVAEEAVRKQCNGRQATRADKILYRLWKESNETCPYTGTRISLSMLFSSQVDIEHIIPFSRCLDDSFANKSVCMAEHNQMVKKNQTPYEAYNGTEQYEAVLQRVEDMKCGKHKKKLFRLTPDQVQEIYGDFASRNLNDTRYLSRLVKDYVKLLGCDVQVSKGAATAALRHKWG